MTDENRRHHLLTIQAIIARLGVNSFLLKGWSITLACGLFALAADKARTSMVYIALVPALMFWWLDAYYLWQEKLFRQLYDRDRVKHDKDIDFSLSTAPVSKMESYWAIMVSQTILIFYGTLLVTIILAIWILHQTPADYLGQ